MDNSIVENVIDNTQSQIERTEQVSEKMIPQSQVNDIVGNAKREAAEKAVENYKRQQTQSYQTQSQSNTGNNLSSKISEDEIRKLTGDEVKRHFSQIEKEFHEKANLEEARRIVDKYSEKISDGKDKYEDFDAVTYEHNEDGKLVPVLASYPNVVHLLAQHVDNVADVVYHLSKNPDKLLRLDLLNDRNPSHSVREVKRLSESIKSNEVAYQSKSHNAPLSQQRPSNTGTDSGSSLSVRDYKKMYKV